MLNYDPICLPMIGLIKEVTEKARNSFIKYMTLVSYKMLLCTIQLYVVVQSVPGSYWANWP
jgi:hypothetical protein